MGFYTHFVLPWLVEKGLDHPSILAQRHEALQEAAGDVLEVGFGPGATVPVYPMEPGRVRTLVGLEPNPAMLRRARARLLPASFTVHLVRGSAAALPFPDCRFDTVTTNWTLCSLADLVTSLREIRRVLRPAGRFLFLEHGRAIDPRIHRRQKLAAPLFRLLGGGCHLDLEIDSIIREAGFRIDLLERYDGSHGPRIARQMYRGIAGV